MAPSENATEELKLSALIPASPNAIYAAWMDERRHSAFTAARATVDQWVGGRVTAVDSFVDATHILLDTGRRIVMTWRTADFPMDSPDSQVEVTLEPEPGGTRVTIHQTGIPSGQAEGYKKLWRSHYLDGMKRFFTSAEAALKAIREAARKGILPTPGLRRGRRPIVGPRPNITSTGGVAAVALAESRTKEEEKAGERAERKARREAKRAARESARASGALRETKLSLKKAEARAQREAGVDDEAKAKVEKPTKPTKPAKVETPAKAEKPAKVEKPAKAEKPAKVEKPAKAEKAEKPAKAAKQVASKPTKKAAPKPTKKAKPTKNAAPKPTKKAAPKPTKKAAPKPTKKAAPKPTKKAAPKPAKKAAPKPTKKAKPTKAAPKPTKKAAPKPAKKAAPKPAKKAAKPAKKKR